MSTRRRLAWLVVDAHHEAAHAVIGTALGQQVTTVTLEGITPNVAYTDPRGSWVKNDPDWLEASVTTTAAGKYAEDAGGFAALGAVQQKGYMKHRELEDRKVAEGVELLAELTDQNADTLMCRVQERARALVELHEEKIAAVAAVLLERMTITGDELGELLSQDD